MMRISRAALSRASLIAAALVLMQASAWADTTVRNATQTGTAGTVSTIKGYTSPDSKEVPAVGMFSPPQVRNIHAGTVATAGVSQLALPANSARRSGYCVSDPRNTDIVEFAFGGAASSALGAPNDCVLTPGNSCGLTSGGGVYQGAVNVTSASAGQAFYCPDFQ